MSDVVGHRSRVVVDWDAGERRRQRLAAELDRIVGMLPGLGVRRAIVFGSLARGDAGARSDVDLILIVDSHERFSERCARFYRALAPRVGTDLLVYTPDEFETMRSSPFLRHALKESRVVYAA